MTRALLTKGDRVGVVATGFAIAPPALAAGLRALERRGLVPVCGEHVRSVHGYLAGDDAARAWDLDTAIADASLRAIWFARGGYGTARILDRVDLPRLIRKPKLLLGFSDLTALFCALLARTRTVCLHAPVVVELGRRDGYHAPSLASALAGRPIERRIAAGDVVRSGQARGRLMGGNLTVLAHLLGTRHMPVLDGAILFLEEIGEEAYRVDRLLQHLRMSGALSKVRGVIVGSFRVPGTAREFPPDRDADEVIREHLLPLGVPIVRNFPSGHVPRKWTLPLGGLATIDAPRGRLVLDPRPTALPARRR